VSCAARLLLGAITSAGRWPGRSRSRIVNDFPDPVMPSSVWNLSPRVTPLNQGLDRLRLVARRRSDRSPAPEAITGPIVQVRCDSYPLPFHPRGRRPIGLSERQVGAAMTNPYVPPTPGWRPPPPGQAPPPPPPYSEPRWSGSRPTGSRSRRLFSASSGSTGSGRSSRLCSATSPRSRSMSPAARRAVGAWPSGRHRARLDRPRLPRARKPSRGRGEVDDLKGDGGSAAYCLDTTACFAAPTFACVSEHREARASAFVFLRWCTEHSQVRFPPRGRAALRVVDLAVVTFEIAADVAPVDVALGDHPRSRAVCNSAGYDDRSARRWRCRDLLDDRGDERLAEDLSHPLGPERCGGCGRCAAGVGNRSPPSDDHRSPERAGTGLRTIPSLAVHMCRRRWRGAGRSRPPGLPVAARNQLCLPDPTAPTLTHGGFRFGRPIEPRRGNHLRSRADVSGDRRRGRLCEQALDEPVITPSSSTTRTACSAVSVVGSNSRAKSWNAIRVASMGF